MTTTAQRLTIAIALLALALAACQPGTNTHPVPSVAQVGGNLKCPSGDHPFADDQVGWGFCYPGTWRYTERAQASTTPPGLDLTFDVTDIPCASPPAGSNASARPICSPGAGLFAFMIISTYERGDSSNLTTWAQTNLTPPQPTPTTKPSPTPQPSPTPLTLQPIQWGNAAEAAIMPDGRRLALTPHHVVILDMHSGQGHLDLEASMSTRLSTWKFTY